MSESDFDDIQKLKLLKNLKVGTNLENWPGSDDDYERQRKRWVNFCYLCFNHNTWIILLQLCQYDATFVVMWS